MKTKFLAIVVAAATAAGTAAAADLPRNLAPYYYPPPAIYNWTGFYAGLNLGYQWGAVSNFSGNPSGIAGGGQIGYNWQVGQFVFGAETDIQVSAADDTFAPWKFSNPWFGTLRGRAGYAMNNILLYATAGLAYGNLTANLAGLGESKTLVG
jgi:outer membrane immunogenic protein